MTPAVTSAPYCDKRLDGVELSAQQAQWASDRSNIKRTGTIRLGLEPAKRVFSKGYKGTCQIVYL